MNIFSLNFYDTLGKVFLSLSTDVKLRPREEV